MPTRKNVGNRTPAPTAAERTPAKVGAARKKRAAEVHAKDVAGGRPELPPDASFRDRVHAAIRAVPEGRVASYGGIAAIIGQPRAARAVGTTLCNLPDGSDVPWWRVVNRNGEISMDRLDESVYRILRLKLKRGLFDNPFVDVDLADKVVGAPDHLADAQVITDHTTTLVKNDAGVLPLTRDSRNVLVTGWGVTTTSTLGNAIGRRGQTVTVLETGTTPSQARTCSAVSTSAPYPRS